MSNRLVCLIIILFLPLMLAVAQEEPRKCTSSEREIYLGDVRSRFYEFWQPPTYATNIRCTLLIKQNFRGEVLFVGIASCTDDRKVHKSVTDAAYEMSPIPLPANKECFARDVVVLVESRSLDDDGTKKAFPM